MDKNTYYLIGGAAAAVAAFYYLTRSKKPPAVAPVTTAASPSVATATQTQAKTTAANPSPDLSKQREYILQFIGSPEWDGSAGATLRYKQFVTAVANAEEIQALYDAILYKRQKYVGTSRLHR